MQRNWNSHTLVVSLKCYNNSEKQFLGVLKFRHASNRWFSPFYTQITQEKRKYTTIQRMYTNVNSSFICNSQNWSPSIGYLVHAQLYQTLCNSMDCSPPGSSVHRILQARILEWVAMPSSRGIFLTPGSNSHLLCLLHWQADSLPLCHPGSPVGKWIN